MDIILIYDVNSKRVGKILKICRKYLIRVQNSVFEGRITAKNYEMLKKEISSAIDSSYDSVRIYIFHDKYHQSTEMIGICKETNFIF